MKWKPYELEAVGGGTQKQFKWSRETLAKKLHTLSMQLSKFSEISEWLKKEMEKNGGKLF